MYILFSTVSSNQKENTCKQVIILKLSPLPVINIETWYPEQVIARHGIH